MRTHAATFCLGVWVMGTVCISVVATQNFYTIDQLLDRPSHAAFARFVDEAGREPARNVLRYLSSELNRLFFQLWNAAQLVSAAPRSGSSVACAGRRPCACGGLSSRCWQWSSS